MKTRSTQGYILESFILAFVITGSLTLAQALFTNQAINWIETAAVFFSFACTWLCTRQVRFNYVLGVISTMLLSYVFWKANLYGSMVLNLYLIPTVIYGWFVWGKDENTLPVKHVRLKAVGLYAFFTSITWLGAYYAIKALGGSMGGLDGWLLVGSILAQYLLDRKKIETWLVWIAVNVVSVYVYFNNGLYLLAAQFIFFLINAVIAYFQWRKTLVKEERTSIAELEQDDMELSPTLSEELNAA